MKMLKVKWTFLEGVLGTSTADEEIYRNYLASKAPTKEAAAEEAEAIAKSADEEFARALTIFPKLEDGTPYQYDYQVKGFFKDACGMLSRLTKKGGKATESSKIKAYKKEIDGNIFVFPRRIPIRFEGELGICQRSLRASTPQGDRVALAASEEAPAGATMEFWVLCQNESHIPAILEWMEYGLLRGTGQWRNSGKGRFDYEIEEILEPENTKEALKMVE